MTEKARPFRLRVRPSRLHYLGVFLSIAGFLLILLSLLGAQSASMQSIYFVQITENPPTAWNVRFGWQGYCLQGECQNNNTVMQMPFDVTASDMLNGSFPHLFADANEPNSDLYPLAAPMPSHNPRIFAAAVLCLMSGGAAVAIGVARLVFARYIRDEYFARGFLACVAAVLSLLLVAESTVMYENGIDQLNLTYPHLVATSGPGVTMTGVAFACFVLAGYTYMQGFFKKEDSAIEEGYIPV